MGPKITRWTRRWDVQKVSKQRNIHWIWFSEQWISDSFKWRLGNGDFYISFVQRLLKTSCWSFPQVCLQLINQQFLSLFRPYMLRVDGAGYREAGYREILFKKACRERHKYIFENFRNFLHKYPNEPKFSLNWITDLAHDNVSFLISFN
jgi:hypothetical protein